MFFKFEFKTFPIQRFTRTRGGNASNNCTVLAELGMTCTFLGTLAKEDQQTGFITKDFEATLSFFSILPLLFFFMKILNRLTSDRFGLESIWIVDCAYKTYPNLVCLSLSMLSHPIALT
jgi:hypothetical protein